jgi:hypothetical protein
VTVSDSSITKKSSKLYQGKPPPSWARRPSTWRTPAPSRAPGPSTSAAALATTRGLSRTARRRTTLDVLDPDAVDQHPALPQPGRDRDPGPGRRPHHLDQHAGPDAPGQRLRRGPVLGALLRLHPGRRDERGVRAGRSPRRLGSTGNVSAGAINAFVSAPFIGATVTNPLPFSNGQARESEHDSYK